MSLRTAIMFLRDPPPDIVSLSLCSRVRAQIFVYLRNISQVGSHRIGSSIVQWRYQIQNLVTQLVLMFQFPVSMLSCKMNFVENTCRKYLYLNQWKLQLCESLFTLIYTHNGEVTKDKFYLPPIFRNVRSKNSKIQTKRLIPALQPHGTQINVGPIVNFLDL